MCSACGGGGGTGAPASVPVASSTPSASLAPMDRGVPGRSARGKDNHPPVRLLTLGLALQPGRRDRVVDDLALERRHRVEAARDAGPADVFGRVPPQCRQLHPPLCPVAAHVEHDPGSTWAATGQSRSEEHTSELQSPVHLVCRLLLEKKNQHYHY